MGNLFSKPQSTPRGPPVGCRPLVFLTCNADPSARGHPAAPAPAFRPGRRLFHRDRGPLPASFSIAPKRQYLIRQTRYSLLGILPLVSWRDLPKKLFLSALNSMMFGLSRTIKTPPPGRKFGFLRSLPEQEVKAGKPVVPTSHLPHPCPKGSEVKVQKDPRKGTAEEEEDPIDIEGLANQNRGPYSNGETSLIAGPLGTNQDLTSFKHSPEPLDVLPTQPEGSLSKKAQMSPMISISESHVTGSQSPAIDVLPTWNPHPHAGMFSPPIPCRSLLPPERLKEEVLDKDHHPSLPGLLVSGKEVQCEKPSDFPSRSSSSLVCAKNRPCKRKIPLPSCLPLPLLLPPPLQLPWDRGELPPPPKLPCLALAKNLDTLEKKTEGQWNKIRKVTEDCSSPQPEPSFSPPALETADSLLPATHTLQAPATTTDLAHLSPSLSVPPPPSTSNADQETRNTTPKSPPLAIPADSFPFSTSKPILGIPLRQNGGPSHSVIATTSLISDHLTPPSIPALSFQPPSCQNESPTPMCVDPPPPFYLPTPFPVPPINPPILPGQPITPMAIPSTSEVMESAGLTWQHTLDPGVTDMDTTPPSKAVIFNSPPGSWVEQRHPAEVPVSIGPSVMMVPCPTPVFNNPFGPQINPQPTFGTMDEQQRASLPLASIFTNPPFMAPAPVFTKPSFVPPAPVFTQPSFVPPAPVFTQASVVPPAPVFTQASVVPPAPVFTQGSFVPPAPVFTKPSFKASAPVSTDTPFMAPASSFTKPPFMASGVTCAPVGSTSVNMPTFDTDAMDTSPPSEAVIFQSAPVSTENHYPFFMAVPSSENTPPSGSNALAHASARLPAKSAKRRINTSKLLLDPVITSQNAFGANDGQKLNNSLLLGNLVAPAQDKSLTFPTAQPPNGSIMQSGWPGPPSTTTVNTQSAFGDNPGILPRDVSTATGFGLATSMPSTRDSSSLFVHTTPGPLVFRGPVAPMDDAVSVPTIGLTHSEASIPFNFNAGLSGATSTTSLPSSGPITWDPSGCSMAAAVGGANTIPAFGHISGSTLDSNTGTSGDAMIARDKTIPKIGRPSGLSGRRKRSLK
uniref:Nuclear pore-associated protein 1-like n=1 Tax=Sus scrofa TaxID=9823 RepID=A0A8D2BT57_PIG